MKTDGLCEDCRWMLVIQSDRGARFVQCVKSFDDPRFPKYPRLPVAVCPGREPRSVPVDTD
jgi:hypothetical protein